MHGSGSCSAVLYLYVEIQVSVVILLSSVFGLVLTNQNVLLLHRQQLPAVLFSKYLGSNSTYRTDKIAKVASYFYNTEPYNITAWY